MRYRLIFVLVVIALSVAACGGGGDEGAGTTDIFDTGTFGVSPVETAPPPPPPAATTEEPQPAIQIAVPKGQPIGPQSPAEQVAQVQTALTALGFKIGKPDGIYGAKTRKAVVRFQKNHQLDADGLVGAKTAKAMNKELAQQASG